MALKYCELVPVQEIKRLDETQVREWLHPSLANREVIRSILVAELQAIRAGHDRDIRTMRGLWYEIVKPLLSRSGRLQQRTENGNPIKWDGQLSAVLAELVREGFTTYDEMKILDGSRKRQPAQEIKTGLIDVTMIGTLFPWVILFTEKDTIWPVIRNLASLYGVSAVSGSGQPSLAATENMLLEILQADPDEIIVLTLTDYDPAGYSISDAQIQQIADVVQAVNQRVSIQFKRLGLEPDQLTPDELEANAYEPADKGLKEWTRRTGGINGRPLGLELDSLPLSRIRGMFAEAVENVTSVEQRYDETAAEGNAAAAAI